jgi:hypothetical protein
LAHYARHGCVEGFYGRLVLPIGSLPNPGSPTSLAIGAVIGGFVGRTIAWRRRYDADKKMQATADGSYCGIGVALLGYLLANLVEASVR